MAAEIVAAYVSNDQMRADEVPDFIRKVNSATKTRMCALAYISTPSRSPIHLYP